MLAKLLQFLRAGIAGMAATGADLATLALLVSVMHVDARVASVPALLVGGVVNFLGNRHFAFRAQGGHVARQAAGYTVVEVVALVLNGWLYDTVLRLVPGARAAYAIVRLVTSHAVFLGWSYPLWKKVFALPGDVATR
jgi:putative flippase GtrA